MARTVAELEVTADADVGKAERKLKGLGTSVDNSAANTRAASMAFIGMGSAIAGGLALAVGTAANFEAAISGIGAVAGLTGGELDDVRTLALQLGTDTTFSATEAAAAMETLLKAGMPIEDVMSGGAQAALDLAAATGTDVVVAAELMTAAMNVFGDSAGSATDVADMFTAAANASASSVESLALGFQQAALPAEMLGLSADDLTVALALFSQNGLQGSDAGTSFKTMLLSLLNPSKEAKAKMDELGLSFFDAQGNFIGLDDSAALLKTQLGGLTEEQRGQALATIFGSDATRAATILFNEGAAGVDGMRTSMEGQATAADQAKARMDNLKGAIETLKGSVETAMIMVGEQFTPALQTLAEKIQGGVEWFTKLDPAMQKTVTQGAVVVAGLFVLAGALAVASAGVGVLTAAFGVLFSPIVLIVAAIAGLYLAYQTNFLGFRDGVNAGIEVLKSAFNSLSPVLDALKSVFLAVWPTIKAALDAAWAGIQTVLDGIKTYFTGMAEVVKGVVNLLVAAVTLDFDGMKDALNQIVGGLVMMVKGQFTVVLGFAQTIFGTMFTLLKGIFTGIKDNAIDLVGTMKDKVIAKFGDLLSAGAVVVDGLKTAVVDTITGMKDDAIAAVTGMVDEVTTVLGDIDDKALDAIGDLSDVLVEAGKSLIQGLMDGINAVLPDLDGLLGGVTDKIPDWKGPADRDAKLLTPSGRLIMGGLVRGIEGEVPTLRASLGGITTAIPMMAQTAPVSQPGGPSTVVYQTNNYTVSIDELEDLANAAEFVRDLPTERELVFGGAFA